MALVYIDYVLGKIMHLNYWEWDKYYITKTALCKGWL